MKKFLIFALIVGGIAVIGFLISGLFEDEAKPEPTFSIEGKWKVYRDENTLLSSDDDDYMNFIINKDGSCSVKVIKDDFLESSEEGYSWSYDDSECILIITNANNEVCYKYELYEFAKDYKSCQWIDLKDKKRKIYHAELK